MLVGIFLLGTVGWIIMPQTNKIRHSLYNREGIARVTEEKFGEVRIGEVITPEIMIVAYDYRNHKPVMFTKYAAS